MFLLAAILSLMLLALGVVAAVAHLAGRRLPWNLTVFRVLVATTVPVWASMLALLWELPTFAARHGAGTGAPWPAQLAAAGGATLIGAVLYIAAWHVVPRAPVLASGIPTIATIAAILARHLSIYGAPAELYLADDARLWMVYALLCLVTTVGLTLYGRHAPRVVVHDDARRSAR